MSELDLSVVLPVFDNERTLDPLLDRLLATLDPLPLSFEIVPVDDGSTDGSLALLRRRAEDDPRIRPVALSRNFGSQAALCAGFDLARGKRIACMDADLENLPEDLPTLLAALDRGHDLACGVREKRSDATFTRRLPSALLNAYVRSRTGIRVRDVGCGMRVMEARVVKGLERAGEHRRLLTPLMASRARSVVEVPIRHAPAPRAGGHSFFSLLAIAADFYLLTARRPFLVSGITSILTALAGGGALLAAALGASGAVAWAGLALALTGGLGVTASLAGEFAQRTYQLSQQRPFYELADEDPARPDPRRSA